MSAFAPLLFLLSACLLGESEAGVKTAAYPHAQLLMEAAELAKPEVTKRFRILDARGKHQYVAGHVPGAVWIDQIAWTRTGIPGPGAEAWAQRIGELGIHPETPVVLYDDNASKDAARLWWILRYWGIHDVRLLNGGWRAWVSSGGPVSKEEVKPPFYKLSLAPETERLATKEQVLDLLKRPGTQFVDARSRGEYCGEETTARRNGAIPGAQHLEWRMLLDDNQRFKSPEALAELFRTHQIKLDQASITYCQSGGRAAVMAFALELMGAKQARNYYKSWAEWGNAADTPIVKPKP